MELVELASVGHEQQFHLREWFGRETFLAEVDAWIAAHADGGVLLLTGGPGAGKSALAAEIARRQDAALHMMKSHRGPARFVGSMVRQLLDRAGIMGRAPPTADVDDLRNALVDALEALSSTHGAAVLVVDGLDELADEAALDVLPRHPPPGVRVILTARPDQALLRRLRATLGNLDELTLAPLTTAEVGGILARRAGRTLETEVVERVAAMSGGLPLLVRHAGDALRDAGRDDLQGLPATVAAFAADALRSIRGAGADAEDRGRIFQLLALAREALGPAEVHALLELDGRATTPERSRAQLEAMSSYLIEPHPGAFRPFHQALEEFVRSEVLGEDGVRKIERLFAEWAAREPAAGYGLRHGTAHRVAASGRDEARDVLERPDVLEAKLRQGLVFDLVRELDLVGSSLAPRVRRHATFLSRHPYALGSVLDVASGGVRLAARRPPSAGAGAASELFVLRGHAGEVYSVALAPDSRLLASAASDATVRLWDVASAAPLRTIEVPARRALAVAISPDGRRVACGTDGAGVLVYDPAGELLHRAGTHTVAWSVAFAPDGRLAVGGRGGDVEICDGSGAALARFASDGIVTAVAFSRDGERVAAATTRGKIVVADASGSVLWRAGPLADTPWSLVWTAERGLVAACADGIVREWSDAGTPGRERVVPDDRLYAAALSPDGASLAVGGKRGLLHTTHAAGDDDEVASVTVHDGAINAIAYTAEGDLVVTASSDGTVRGWPASALHAAGPERQRPHALAISPLGDVVATGHYDGAVRLVRANDLTEIARIAAHDSRIGEIAFSRDGALLATASQDATAKVFRLAPLLTPAGKRAPIADLVGHEGAVTSVAVIGSGGRVITGSRDQTARIWSVFGARQLLTVPHDDTVLAVAADESGELAATLSRDGSLLVLRVEDGSAIARAKLDVEAVGHTLAFGSQGALRLQDRAGALTVWLLEGSTLRKLDPPAARAYLPRFMLRTDARLQESVVLESTKLRHVAAFPGLLALAAATPDGGRFAGWWAGDLQVLDVEVPAPSVKSGP